MPKYSKNILGKVRSVKGELHPSYPPSPLHIVSFIGNMHGNWRCYSCSVLMDQNYASSQCSQDSGLLGILLKGAAGKNSVKNTCFLLLNPLHSHCHTSICHQDCHKRMIWRTVKMVVNSFLCKTCSI